MILDTINNVITSFPKGQIEILARVRGALASRRPSIVSRNRLRINKDFGRQETSKRPKNSHGMPRAAHYCRREKEENSSSGEELDSEGNH